MKEQEEVRNIVVCIIYVHAATAVHMLIGCSMLQTTTYSVIESYMHGTVKEKVE